jgi:sulfate transporter 4
MSANVQGAIIIVGVLGLFQHEDFIHLWRVSKPDWLQWVVTFLCTLFLGVEIGILIGVAVSLVLVVYATAFPRITSIGRLPGSNIYRNVAMYPDAECPPGMVLLRIDAPIFFANVEGIKDYLLEQLRLARAQQAAQGHPVRFVIIDLSPSPDVDVSGLHLFQNLVADLRADGIALLLANPSRSVLIMLKRVGLVEEIGEHGIHVSVGDAVRYATAHAEEEAASQVAVPL